MNILRNSCRKPALLQLNREKLAALKKFGLVKVAIFLAGTSVFLRSLWDLLELSSQ